MVVAFLCVAHALLTFLVATVVIFQYPNHAQAVANALGLVATILSAIQYLPQIYTTWRLQAVHSLSIPMMCIQTPGSFVFAGSLAARLGKSGWSTWGIFLVTGCLQGCLLAMAIWFEVRDRRSKKTTVNRGEGSNGIMDGDEQLDRNEQTPLLNSQER